MAEPEWKPEPLTPSAFEAMRHQIDTNRRVYDGVHWPTDVEAEKTFRSAEQLAELNEALVEANKHLWESK